MVTGCWRRWGLGIRIPLVLGVVLFRIGRGAVALVLLLMVDVRLGIPPNDLRGVDVAGRVQHVVVVLMRVFGGRKKGKI
jgi:hypothetical protein